MSIDEMATELLDALDRNARLVPFTVINPTAYVHRILYISGLLGLFGAFAYDLVFQFEDLQQKRAAPRPPPAAPQFCPPCMRGDAGRPRCASA